jgi:hypothetical protein
MPYEPRCHWCGNNLSEVRKVGEFESCGKKIETYLYQCGHCKAVEVIDGDRRIGY